VPSFYIFERGLSKMTLFDLLATVVLLLGLEIVLGIDNVIVIAILVARMPQEIRRKARFYGLTAALALRLFALYIVVALTKLTAPVFFMFSVRDLIMLLGGAFLLWKASKEIYIAVELKGDEDAEMKPVGSAIMAVMTQIMLLDLVFSVDSVITAVGLVQNFWVIATAVVLSFIVVLLYAGPVGEFIIKHPALKILALAFLVTIGVTLVLEGIHKHIPKTYLYLPMSFAFFVQLLQMRRDKNARRKKELEENSPN